MENNILELIIILVVALGVGGMVYYVFPILKAKKLNLNDIFETTNSLMAVMDGFIKTMKEIFPKNKELSIVDKVFEYCHIAVREAEQLYITSEIKEEDRKDKAEEYVYNILKQLNIPITDEVKKIVSGAIESEVYKLGHTPKDVKDIKKENLDLKKENELLKAKTEVNLNTVR